MVTRARILAAIGFACVIAVAASVPASATESSFLSRFKGNWTGAGTVTKDTLSVHVSCKAVGEPGDNHIVVQGNCGIAMISRPMIADLTYDPASGRYSGTYVGAKVGPARLSGKRNGNHHLSEAGQRRYQGDAGDRKRRRRQPQDHDQRPPGARRSHGADLGPAPVAALSRDRFSTG